MKLKCNDNLNDAILMVEKLKELANKGFEDSNDDTCMILYGVINDAAFRIKEVAEKEIIKHKKLNKWE